MGEPTEGDVFMVVEITATDPETARRFLKVKNNNVEQAINALLEGEDISKAETAVQWDDSAWTTDRDGTSYGPQMPAPYSESNLHPLGTSAAPTRGSSPVPSLRQPATKAEEDEELEKAMANSRQDLGYAGQESGIISAGNRLQSHFGPATRAKYDPSQWAMVPTAATQIHEAKEIIPDVEPSARKTEGLEPRFLKHTASGDYLPNLLTIAHSIPLARETLLLRDHIQSGYGQDPDWWRGHEIKLPTIVSTVGEDSGQAVKPETYKMVAEMQRLIAFLDSSDRSYASTENLVQIAEQLATNIGDIPMDMTLAAWEAAAVQVAEQDNQDDTGFDRLFHSTVGSGAGVQTPNLWSLPLSIPDRPRSGELTLADVMDHALWDMDPEDENFADNWMIQCGEVLPMRVVEDDPAQDKLRLVVPTSLYIDKYLEEHVEVTRPVRKEMSRLKRRQATLESLQQSLAKVEHPTSNENLEALDILRSTKDYFSGASRQKVLDDNEARGIDLPTDSLSLPPAEQEAHTTMAQKLDSLWTSITEKIATLEEEKHRAKEALSRLSQSNPPGLEQDKLKHHYTLRGVATKPNVTYVLRPRYKPLPGPQPDAMETSTPTLPPPPTPSEIDLTPNPDDPDAPPGWVWWRIQLDNTLSTSTIHKTESSTDEVLRAVELEHNAALLVYASDNAVAFPSEPDLPDELRRFIAADNRLFQNELRNFQHNGGARVSVADQGWGTEYIEGGRERRGSAGSTMVNFDEGEDGNGDLPAYSFDGGWREGGKGLLGAEDWEQGRGSPEAHEIRLDEGEGAEGQGQWGGKGAAGKVVAGDGLLAERVAAEEDKTEKDRLMESWLGPMVYKVPAVVGRAPSVDMVDVDDEREKEGKGVKGG